MGCEDKTPRGDDLPCKACIEEGDGREYGGGWDEGDGRQYGGRWDFNAAGYAGYACCNALSPQQIGQQPLCGLCLRVQKGVPLASALPKKLTADQLTQYEKCGQAYCAWMLQLSGGQLKGYGRSSVSLKPLITTIRDDCDPETLRVIERGERRNGWGII